MMYTQRHMDGPIVCTLSTTELQERKMTILASLRNAVTGQSEALAIVEDLFG